MANNITYWTERGNWMALDIAIPVAAIEDEEMITSRTYAIDWESITFSLYILFLSFCKIFYPFFRTKSSYRGDMLRRRSIIAFNLSTV